jgi:hypothetical protein
VENPSRRRVLTAGLTGAVTTALIGSRVAATTPTEPPTTEASGETAGTDAVPTTTAAPVRPTGDDIALLAFAQGAELAARDLYALAIETGAEGDGDQALAAARANHQAAGNAISALIGGAAPQTADAALVSSLESGFASTDLAAVAAAGLELENTLVATHTAMIGQLTNLGAASRVAAILIAEAQMAAVLADLAGNQDDPSALFDNPATALTPSEG